jgi:hypothetical protein
VRRGAPSSQGISRAQCLGFTIQRGSRTGSAYKYSKVVEGYRVQRVDAGRGGVQRLWVGCGKTLRLQDLRRGNPCNGEVTLGHRDRGKRDC